MRKTIIPLIFITCILWAKSDPQKIFFISPMVGALHNKLNLEYTIPLQSGSVDKTQKLSNWGAGGAFALGFIKERFSQRFF